MTIEERIAALEKRVTRIERVTTPMMPLGRKRKDDEALAKERDAVIERPVEAFGSDKSVPEVDRTQRVLADGSPVTADHREIKADSGQQKGYVVLSAAERAKGFVRPVRRSYTHKNCGSETTMGVAIAETYARDPGFYSGTFCCNCREHRPLTEFVWKGTNEQVGS